MKSTYLSVVAAVRRFRAAADRVGPLSATPGGVSPTVDEASLSDAAAGRSVLAHLIDLIGRDIVAADGPATIRAHYRLRHAARRG